MFGGGQEEGLKGVGIEITVLVSIKVSRGAKGETDIPGSTV